MTGGHAPLPQPKIHLSEDADMDDVDGSDDDDMEDNQNELIEDEPDMQNDRIHNGSRRRPLKPRRSDKFRIVSLLWRCAKLYLIYELQ